MRDFVDVCNLAKTSVKLSDFKITPLKPPHTPTKLPENKMALYGFIYGKQWLKIGIVDCNSNPRFQYQHYKPKSSGSNLAKSILNDKTFPETIDESKVGNWIRQNCFRINIFVPKDYGNPILRLLEAFFHVRFSPRYER